MIWTLCDGSRSTADVAEALQDVVDDDLLTIRQDVFDTVEHLIEKGVLCYPDSALPVGKVYMYYFERTGNHMFCYCFGRIVAEKLQYELHINPMKHFPNTHHNKRYEEKLEHETEENSYTITDHCRSPEQLDEILHEIKAKGILTVRFYGAFFRYAFYQNYQYQIRNHWLQFNYQSPVKPNINDVVVHIRSGDLWEWNRPKNAHAHQAPKLSFYTAILDQMDFEHAYLVCENSTDPMLNFLHAKYPSTIVSNSVHDDLALLIAAPRLIMSPSTFAWWGAYLSNASEVHYPVNHYTVNELQDLRIYDDRYTLYDMPPIHDGWTGSVRDLRLYWDVSDDSTCFAYCPQESMLDVLVRRPVSGDTLPESIQSIQDRVYGLHRAFDESDLPVFSFPRETIQQQLDRVCKETVDWVYHQLETFYLIQQIAESTEYLLLVDGRVIMEYSMVWFSDNKVLWDAEETDFKVDLESSAAGFLSGLRYVDQRNDTEQRPLLIQLAVFREFISHVEQVGEGTFAQQYLAAVKASSWDLRCLSVQSLYQNYLLSSIWSQSIAYRPLDSRRITDVSELHQGQNPDFDYSIIG